MVLPLLGLAEAIVASRGAGTVPAARRERAERPRRRRTIGPHALQGRLARQPPAGDAVGDRALAGTRWRHVLPGHVTIDVTGRR